MRSDTLAMLFFIIIGLILELTAWKFTQFEGMMPFAALVSFIGLISICFGLYVKSDFKKPWN